MADELTLVIMAAGAGSRFGGLKQLAPIGPNGETLMEFSIHDAFAAQFKKVVIVIRREAEFEFSKRFKSPLTAGGNVSFVFQEIDAAVPPFMCPNDRSRPWGTGHAILCARDEIRGPFAVINADDYYGPSSLEMMGRFLATPKTPLPMQGAMVGFRLGNTLSNHGAVSRGFCQLDDHQRLTNIIECHQITRCGDDGIRIDPAGSEQRINGNEIVSMNLWGFPHTIFESLEQRFRQFLDRDPSPTDEFEIPGFVQQSIDTEQLQITVLKTEDPWCGLTYQEDLPDVITRFQSFTARGPLSKPRQSTHD